MQFIPKTSYCMALSVLLRFRLTICGMLKYRSPMFTVVQQQIWRKKTYFKSRNPFFSKSFPICFRHEEYLSHKEVSPQESFVKLPIFISWGNHILPRSSDTTSENCG
ncbi:hypothetical protein CEXT_693871 [Caerostris extrusa]|uniref:Uncharacterized protein n=1 Tax=Caerostris extrusa TaxID=172846 RepID=A0AAV4SFI7_CAEEX|nr:hypothetical protein CEXT_693871 [Caerostris extrusa]